MWVKPHLKGGGGAGSKAPSLGNFCGYAYIGGIITLMILIFQKFVSRLLLICDGCLLIRNCSIQGEDYKYDKINGEHVQY